MRVSAVYNVVSGRADLVAEVRPAVGHLYMRRVGLDLAGGA